jgi:hypothetical protein
MTTRRNKALRHHPSKARRRRERGLPATRNRGGTVAVDRDQRDSDWGVALLQGLYRRASFNGRPAHVREGGGYKVDPKQERREARRLQRAKKRGG